MIGPKYAFKQTPMRCNCCKSHFRRNPSQTNHLGKKTSSHREENTDAYIGGAIETEILL